MQAPCVSTCGLLACLHTCALTRHSLLLLLLLLLAVLLLLALLLCCPLLGAAGPHQAHAGAGPLPARPAEPAAVA
jgi:hypothetical protein